MPTESVRDSVKKAVADSAKKDKAEVQYSKGMPRSHCGICEYYANNGCSKVKGFISPSMWCKLFERK